MAWFADGGPCGYGLARPAWALAAGWLDPAHPFATGPEPEGFVARIAAMIDECARNEGIEHLLTREFGGHPCPFCPGSHSDGGVLLIPEPEHTRAWAMPHMIGHYVSAHGYLPPAACLAVAARCPEYGSPAYCAGMTAISGTDWSRYFT